MKKPKKVSKKSVDETQKLKNLLARALADYDNLQKRVEKEKQVYRKLALVRVVARILPAVDMLEETQDHLKDSGLAIALKELFETFEDEGVEKVDSSKGLGFDEKVHEAVEVEGKSQKGKAIIAEEVLPGWKIDDILIRPAKVKVKKGK